MRLASDGHGFSEVEQSSWAMFASLSSGPVTAFGTANSGSGDAPLAVADAERARRPGCECVFSVATTIRTRKAIPTKVE